MGDIGIGAIKTMNALILFAWFYRPYFRRERELGLNAGQPVLAGFRRGDMGIGGAWRDARYWGAVLTLAEINPPRGA